ncbi:tachykinin-like peptides receptor 86C [Daphnia carinata]|uniref:tachykinin-like peptides receptor 86C n=1 Tax=Daphnia carinata TaxID=120202 RepID=UPI0025801849|nr:tachykinin-like peptides receptor 86C [Daphnia carinata]
MINDDDEDAPLEDVFDSNEGWRTTDIPVGRLFSFYVRNTTSYVANKYYTNIAENQQLDVIGPEEYADGGYPSSKSVSIPPEVEWPRDAEEDFFMADVAGFNGSFSNTNFSYPGNMTLHREGNFSSPYMMPWPQRTSWIAVFTLLVVVAAVGNSLVVWIVLAHKRMKTVTNYFLVNLSLADLTMTLFNCIFNFTFMLNNHWPFGGFYCTVNNFVANVTVAASVFTLVAISFDRYIAIVYPLRPRMSKSTARIAISLIWCASCVLAIPCLLYSQTISHSYRGGEIRIVCIIVWPDGVPSVSQQDFIYNIVFTVSTYLIPVIVMGACYSRMGYVLWRGKSIGEQNQRQAESIQSKHKVVRMFMVVVTLFVVCWLPYHGYFVYQFIDDQVISYKHVQHIFLSFYWLAMSNTMINPLVYYYMNTRFREHFRSALCCRARPSALNSTASTAGSAIIITRAGQRSTPILRNDRADFVTGPRQPRQVLNQRQFITSAVIRHNGRDVIPLSEVSYTAAENTHLIQRQDNSEGERLNSCGTLEKSSLLLDSPQQQRILVSSDTSISNGTAAWISSQGHLVTVWTSSSATPLSTAARDDGNQHSMNLINARMHIRRNPSTDVCADASKIHQTIAETIT